MGIITRFSDIMKSNINALLDKCEDPAKMVDQTLRDLREDLAQVKKETASIMADATAANRKVEECQASIDKYTRAAENAIKAGNEADARTLIAKKQEFENQMITLKKNADLNNANAEKMHQMHDKLVADIDALEARRDTVKSTVAATKAQERINNIQDGGKRAASSMDAFNRMEEKANKALDEAMAHSELNAGIHATDDLADKYAGGAGNSSVDDELAAMKAKLGM